MALGSGPLFFAAFLTIAGTSLVIAIRGVLSRSHPEWYKRVLLVTGTIAVIVSAVGGSLAVAGALVRL